MKLTSYKDLDNLCFSDFDVYRIDIDGKQKIFYLDLEGVLLIKNNSKKEFSRGYVKITGFKKFVAVFSNSILKKKGVASIEQIKELTEISEHEVGDNYVEIFGFTNDGSWLECRVEGGSVIAKFTE